MTLPILPALVTVLALLVYAWTIAMCGNARGKYGIKAPAVTGHPEFEKRFRIQQNTLEQLVVFLPSLWIFAFAVSPLWAALLGLVFVVGRVLYGVGYARAAESRSAGFTIGAVATTILLLGGLAGLLWRLIAGAA